MTSARYLAAGAALGASAGVTGAAASGSSGPAAGGPSSTSPWTGFWQGLELDEIDDLIAPNRLRHQAGSHNVADVSTKGLPADKHWWCLREAGMRVVHQDSLKGKALAKAGRYTLVAQVETPPVYQYVSVEGAIVETRPVDLEADLRPMAHRYFGAELGDAYVGGGSGEGDLVFTMQPERWRTVDYRKMGAS